MTAISETLEVYWQFPSGKQGHVRKYTITGDKIGLSRVLSGSIFARYDLDTDSMFPIPVITNALYRLYNLAHRLIDHK